MAPSPLDDPERAAYAWARYRRLMWWMGSFTLVVVVATLTYMWFAWGVRSIHFYIATALGMSAAILLMAALMGLVFLSSGTGHDESIEDRLDPD